MPIAVWLRCSLRDWAEELLVCSDLESAGLCGKVVRDVWNDHLSGNDRMSEIWTVLMYRQWQENWKQGRN